MKVNTEKFKELVSKSIVGASNNKLIPITQFMGIKKFNDAIQLITTDATNYLYVYGNIDADITDDIEVTVYAEQFAKLISKMTSKEITLEIKDNALEVTGNGTYSIELPLDETGEIIKYPNPASEIKSKPNNKIALSDIRVILDTIKPSLATDMSTPALANYFVGDKIMATDSYKIASFDKQILDNDYLISPELLDLFSVISADTVTYVVENDSILFDAGDIVIYGKLANEEYPVEVLEKLIEEEFPSVCKINKADFLNALDRMSLFVSKYDDKAIRLYFEKDGVIVANKNRKSNEKLDYASSNKHKDFDCVIDIEFLTTQIKAYASDVVELHYGKDNSIKLVDGNITQVIALNEK